MSTPLRIERVPITHADAQALIEAVQEVYVGLYGGRDETPIQPGSQGIGTRRNPSVWKTRTSQAGLGARITAASMSPATR